MTFSTAKTVNACMTFLTLHPFPMPILSNTFFYRRPRKPSSYALREKDTRTVNTRNRRLTTTGFRVFSRPTAGQFDFDLESVLQTGEQRSNSSASNLLDQDQNAFFHYAILGYSFDLPSRLRIMFEFDYASGDGDPFDGDSERFDSLFGVTTFEFRPAGMLFQAASALRRA